MGKRAAGGAGFGIK
ncbi:uncharacterized, partial [Tachysurus ichikawai]